MKNVDFGQVVESYSRSRNDIPHNFFDSLHLRNIAFEGKKIADIGCGTGLLTRKLKYRKADVIGIDPSPELLEEARNISKSEFLYIPYKQGLAERTGLEDSFYHIVTVMRAWHWFNREEALNEIKRILKDNGTLVIADSGFTPSHAVIADSINIIKRYSKGDIGPAGSKAASRQRINGFPVEWFEEWRLHGFEMYDFYKLDYLVTFSNEEWVDRFASLSWLANMEQTDREAAVSELSATLEAIYGKTASHTIPHSCQVCILKRRDGA